VDDGLLLTEEQIAMLAQTIEKTCKLWLGKGGQSINQSDMFSLMVILWTRYVCLEDKQISLMM
jgi:hypothetical protein